MGQPECFILANKKRKKCKLKKAIYGLKQAGTNGVIIANQ